MTPQQLLNSPIINSIAYPNFKATWERIDSLKREQIETKEV